MAIPWRRTLSSCRNQVTDATGRDSGITLVELMIAIVLMSVVFVGVLAYFQLAMAANLRVSNQASYSQELSLMASQILDGSGGQFLGLRQAKAVHVSCGHGRASYTFTYGGSDTGHAETYWSHAGRLYRSRATGIAEEMGRANELRIASVEGAGDGVYAIEITGGAEAGTANEVEYSTYVRLRNCTP